MAQVVILSELVSYGELGAGRYMAPYVLASQLEANGFSTVVVDFFTKKENFFEYLSHFIDQSTLLVGISTTFLSPFCRFFDVKASRQVAFNNYQSGFLWANSEEEWLNWLHSLRSLLSQKAPRAKIVVGGTKATKFLAKPELSKGIDYLALGAGDASLVNATRAIFNGTEPVTKLLYGVPTLAEAVLKNQMSHCPTTIYQPKWAIQERESLPIEISRGCIFNCKFCYYERKNSVRKNVSVLMEEFQRNYDLFGTTSYSFTDDCFNDSREKVETICGAILYHFRSLGYSKEDLFSRFLDNNLKFELANEVAGRNSEYLEKYWADLTHLNPPSA